MMNCPVCQASHPTIFAKLATPYLDHSESYRIMVCGNCSHGYADGRDDDEFLKQIYNDEFHDTSQQSVSSGNSPIELNAIERTAWLAAMGKRGRLLDVGAGKGIFVKAADAVFDAQGIELSETAAAAARANGTPIIAGDFLSLPSPSPIFNVITFWDVLASMRNPGAALERASQSLEHRGVVVATLPMIDSLAARAMRRYWPLLIPPVNLQYFSRRSIALLATQHGFKLDLLIYQPKRVALSFLSAKAARSLRLYALGSILGKYMPNWPISINTGDIACVVLSRVEGGDQT